MIIIFRDDLTVAAVLDPAQGTTDVRDDAIRSRLEEFGRSMIDGVARIRLVTEEDGVRRIGHREVRPGEPDYEDALLSELRARRFSAITVSGQAMPLFAVLDTERFTVEQRRQVIGILRNLVPELQRELSDAVCDIAALGSQMKDMRTEWDAFVKRMRYTKEGE